MSTTGLPAEGLPPERVHELVAAAGADDADWRAGRSWSLVYDSPDWHADLVARAVATYANENSLSHTAFPSAGRFESAVVSMVASVVAPGADAFGSFTSGGTESILLAVKAYRDCAPDIDRPELALPATAHPAFGKAAHYLRVGVREVPVGASGAVDPGDVRAALTPQTIAIAASAPNFPFGVVDPIPELAALAREHDIGLHVDAAMGGLFLPFLDAAGVTPPRFGLDVDGVTSVSVDLHKYGYGPKGGSVVLFGTDELRRASYYISLGWPGGAYASATSGGTRPVGPAAGAFAAMAALGRAGYRRLVADVMTTARTLQDGLLESGPMRLVGRPAMSVFAVTSDELAMTAFARGLESRGWWIDAQTEPPAIHFVVFPRHATVVAAFLADVAAVLAGSLEDRADGSSSYGVMVRGVANIQTLRDYLDRRFDDGWWDQRA